MFHVEHRARAPSPKGGKPADCRSVGDPPKGPFGGNADPAGEARVQRSVAPEDGDGCRVLDPAHCRQGGAPQTFSRPPAGLGRGRLGYGEEALGRQEPGRALSGNRGRAESPGGDVLTTFPELPVGQLLGATDQHVRPAGPIESCGGFLEEGGTPQIGVHQDEVCLGPDPAEDQSGHASTTAEVEEAVGGMGPCQGPGADEGEAVGQVGLDRPRPEEAPALGFAEQVEKKLGVRSGENRPRRRAGAR